MDGPWEFVRTAGAKGGVAVLDEIAGIAARSYGAPMGLVSLIDDGRQSFVGRRDWCLDSLAGAAPIGAECLRAGKPVCIADTHAVAELAAAPFVTAPPHVRWFVMAPVLSATGQVVGTIGALDRAPRDPVSGDRLELLCDLARLVRLNAEAIAAAARGRVFEDVVEAAQEGVWLTRADSTTVYVNRRMAEICGRRPDEMIDRSFFDFLPSAAQADAQARWGARKQGRSEKFERQFVRPDGSEVLTLTNSAPLFDASGAFAGAVAMVTDISALKATEAALKRSEAELQRAQRIAHLGHWTWQPDPDTATPWRGISIYSPAGAAIFGVTPEELRIPSDEYVARFVHPDDRERVSRTLQEYGGPVGEGYTLEYRILRADGETRIIREIAELVRDADGAYLHTLGALQDVTEARHAEAALRESESRFRMIADTMPNLLWMADAEGHITFLNQRWEEYSGIPASDNIGRIWALEAHPEDSARLDAQYRSGLYPIGAHEVRLQAKDGSYRWFLDTAAYRYGDTGAFLGYVGTLTDIDDMKRLNEQLHQAQKMEAVGQLTGGIAHDFNNQLTVILGNAELLEERLTDPALLRLATATRGAAERSAALVRRLLAFSRRQTLQPSVTDVNELIVGMQDLLDRTLGPAIEVQVPLDQSAPAVLVDRAQLESAILNLAINARDAMPAGGRLVIETATTQLDGRHLPAEEEVAPGDYVMVAVSDTGCGMTDEVMRHAFEPFFTTKGVGQGSGLGLSMVYGFIKQSGGHVRLYSEPGTGTSVKMFLRPAAATQGHEMASDDADAEPLAGGHEKILVVEDDDQVRDYVTGQLLALGYRVISAKDGPQALAALERDGGVDLLFTDVAMPGGLNGRQLVEAALARRPGLKILYTTGYTRDAIVHDGRLDAGIDLLSKPYPRRELARKLREVLDRRTRQGTTR